MTEWRNFPSFTIDTLYGPFTVTMSGPDWAYCSVGRDGRTAHVNDRVECLTYRGTEYIGSVRLAYEGEGEWARWTVRDSHLTKRQTWTDAPPTHRDQMVMAARVAFVDYLDAHPELMHGADVAETMRNLHQAERDTDATREAYETARAAEQALRDHLASLESQEVNAN